MVPMAGIGPATSPLPRECSTTEPHGQLAPLAQHQKSLLNKPAQQTMERETGIEPASLAWKARVLPLNYSRADHRPLRTQLCTRKAKHHSQHCSLTGGGDWIRTSVGVSQQIYSLPPLATRAPLRRISNYSTKFLRIQKLNAFDALHKRCKRSLLHVPLVRLAGIEPTTLGFGGQYSIH